MAQNAYNQWVAAQGTEMHLLGNFKEKWVYGSETGDKNDLTIMQVQKFEKGRMVRDIMYKQYPSQIMFDMVVSYEDDNTAIGTNVLDSSKVTYSFTEDEKIRYYVVDRQSATHVIYTYNDDALLIHCKDCLDPFEGQHQWCAYFVYSYNENKQLEKAASYSLEKGKPVTSKTLFLADSLVYENDLLSTRLTINPAGNTTQKVIYTYNKKKQLIEEYFTQLEMFLEPRSYTKTYTYHCNRKMKTKSEAYYTSKELQGTQNITYDKKGRKTKQESIRADGKRTKLYEMYYK